ncbi:MAG: dienelactone hydrolase family protein [Candidatus Levyibacteriota bacterium]
MTQAASAEVRIPFDGVLLSGTLSRPPQPRGIVAFAHGSGSSRLSPRNVYVARVLFDAGFGALLFDLLTQDEDRDYATRFDIDLLSERLRGATRWLRDEPRARGLPLGYFGASTGAAAALVAAADPHSGVGAVVSRGGRPDLAGAQALGRVRAPTLLIVGGEDHEVIVLNRDAYARLRCEKSLSIVPGATHLFEEPGTLETVAARAAQWFTRHLASPIAGRDAGISPESSS